MHQIATVSTTRASVPSFPSMPSAGDDRMPSPIGEPAPFWGEGVPGGQFGAVPDMSLVSTTGIGKADQLPGGQFGAVRDAVEVSDSALSKHASALEQAGYVAVRKGYVGKRPRTWLKLTPPGRDALAAHLAALRRIAGDG